MNIFAVFAFIPNSQAQEDHKAARITGTILDPGGHPLAGIVVNLQSGSQPLRQERTDAKGRYVFNQLPSGDYTVRAEGSSAVERIASAPIFLKDAETKTVNLILASPARQQRPEFYDEPTFTVAGVSESSGAGVHASDSTMRNADGLAKATASLAKETPDATLNAAPTGSANSRTVEHLQQLIAANDQASLHNQLGHAEEDSGNALEALREFQRAAEMDPSEANLFDWGTELLMHRAAEPAAEVLTRGNRLYPHSVRMLTGLAVAEYARGVYGAAVDRLCQASDLDPHDPIPYTFLGQMQNPEVKRSPDALAKFARYAQLYPDNAEANYFYAVALWNQPEGPNSNASRVESLLRKALAMNPGFALAYLQLGILENSRQRFQEASLSLNQAIAIDPTLEEAHYRLAQIYRRLGDTAKAQQEFEIYQRLVDTTNQSAERERKMMQQFVYQLKAPTVPAEHR